MPLPHKQIFIIFIIIFTVISTLFLEMPKSPMGKISGITKGEHAQSLSGVTINLTNVNGKIITSTKSGNDGMFMFPAQSAGKYTLNGYLNLHNGSYYSGHVTFTLGTKDIVQNLTLALV